MCTTAYKVLVVGPTIIASKQRVCLLSLPERIFVAPSKCRNQLGNSSGNSVVVVVVGVVVAGGVVAEGVVAVGVVPGGVVVGGVVVVDDDDDDDDDDVVVVVVCLLLLVLLAAVTVTVTATNCMY